MWNMSLNDFKAEVSGEISGILASEFTIEVVETKTVPTVDDAALTYPNLDTGRQVCKLIETCVLYVDIRKSTDLNLTHHRATLAKLYSAFVRAMAKSARYFGGHVRGIVGDRLMVVFDSEDCFSNAVDAAVLMNSVCNTILDKKFVHNDVKCGIGVDYGKMLVTKTGVIRQGTEKSSYKGLVWLGRPANVASKLTDLAAKGPTSVSVPAVREGFYYSNTKEWLWLDKSTSDFIGSLRQPSLLDNAPTNSLIHKDPHFKAAIATTGTKEIRGSTPKILMTKVVRDGYAQAKPNANINTKGFLRSVSLGPDADFGEVFGGDIYFIAFNE
jgi:adenylate cyclase